MGLEPTDAAMRRIACVACPSASASLLFCLPHVCSIALLRQLHANREHFSARYASESDDSGEQAKMSSRSSAFVEKYRAVLGENASPSPEAAASLAAAASRRVEGGEDGGRRATWAVYRLTDDERG